MHSIIFEYEEDSEKLLLNTIITSDLNKLSERDSLGIKFWKISLINLTDMLKIIEEFLSKKLLTYC